MNIPLIISKIENYLRDHSIAGAYERWIERYSIPVSMRDDCFLFEKLTQATFSGGLLGAIVDKKMRSMSEVFDNWDPKIIAGYSEEVIDKKFQSTYIIQNRPKLLAMLSNAKEICRLSSEYGSFAKFLISMPFNDLVTGLQSHFNYLGPVTAHDFLRNIGFDTIKLDRHVLRWMSRIGLLKTNISPPEIMVIARDVAAKCNISLAKLDCIIYLLCASRNDVISEPLCLEEPKCSICPVDSYCKKSFDNDSWWYQERSRKSSLSKSKKPSLRVSKGTVEQNTPKPNSFTIWSEIYAGQTLEQIKTVNPFASKDWLNNTAEYSIVRKNAVTTLFNGRNEVTLEEIRKLKPNAGRYAAFRAIAHGIAKWDFKDKKLDKAGFVAPYSGILSQEPV